jgi:hypothetical protein
VVNEILSLDIEKPKLIQITNYKDKRSLAQNRLYYGWISDISKNNLIDLGGNDTEFWHRYLKYKFLVPIFLASEKKKEWQEMWYSIQELKNTEYDYNKIVTFVIDNTSTTDANTKEFTEYLECIQEFCTMKGIPLRTDMELIKEALGYEFKKVGAR